MKLYEQYPGLLYSRGKLRDSHVEALVEGGYAVIALAPPTPNEAVKNAVQAYYHIPVPDGKLTYDAKGKFHAAAATAVNSIMQKQPVIVHCNAGRNRAGLVCALILRTLLNLTGREAMEMVRSVRPRAIANPEFEDWLRGMGRPREELRF